MKSALSGNKTLSNVHRAIQFFDDPEELKADHEYLGHEPESYLVVGFPGSGKTTLAATFPGPYFLNADRKHAGIPAEAKRRTFNHGDKVFAETVLILDALSNLQTRKKYGIKTLVLDTVSSLSELMEVEVLANPELNPQNKKHLLIQHYNTIQHYVSEIVRRTYESGLDIVVTAHPDEVQDSDGDLVYHPAITGKKGGPKLGGKFDNVLWIEKNDNGFISTLKGSTRFPHAKLAVSKEVYKAAPERVADLTYARLQAVKSGKAKVKKKESA